MNTIEAYDRMGRYQRTAATWVRKSGAVIRAFVEDASTPEQVAVAGYDAERLLSAMLTEAESLVAFLNDDDSLADVERDAKEIARRARALRLAGKLAVVEGRTVAEAAIFVAKAEELRR